jgi:hypothetical protein
MLLRAIQSSYSSYWLHPTNPQAIKNARIFYTLLKELKMLRVNFLDPHPIALISFAVGPRSENNSAWKATLADPNSVYSPVFGIKPFVIISLFIHSAKTGKLASRDKPPPRRARSFSAIGRFSSPSSLFESWNVNNRHCNNNCGGTTGEKNCGSHGVFKISILSPLILLGPAPVPALSPRSQVQRYSVLRSCLRSSDPDVLQFYCWEHGGTWSKRTRGVSLLNAGPLERLSTDVIQGPCSPYHHVL